MPRYLYENRRTGRTVELFRRIEERDATGPDLRRLVAAPRVMRGAQDPTVADMAVPRAFRELEQTMPASEIARNTGFSVAKLKRVWDFKN